MGSGVIDPKGFRAGVGIIITNARGEVLLAKRIAQAAWQFPQGGLQPDETPEEAMYRELYEEVGLLKEEVELIVQTKRWLYYRLPKYLIRRHSQPLCIGQKQKWFLLRLLADESRIHFGATTLPEFDAWQWASYWKPLDEVIHFKRGVYRAALKEFAPLVLPNYKRLHRLF